MRDSTPEFASLSLTQCKIKYNHKNRNSINEFVGNED